MALLWKTLRDLERRYGEAPFVPDPAGVPKELQ